MVGSFGGGGGKRGKRKGWDKMGKGKGKGKERERKGKGMGWDGMMVGCGCEGYGFIGEGLLRGGGGVLRRMWRRWGDSIEGVMLWEKS